MNAKEREALIQKLIDADQYNIMHDNELLVYILREGTKGYDKMTEDELLQAAGQEGEDDKEARRATDPSDEELGLDGEELTADNLTPEGMGQMTKKNKGNIAVRMSDPRFAPKGHPKKKERSVTFSITVFETVASGEDTVDMGDGEIEVVFTGYIHTGLCISEMKSALLKAMRSKRKLKLIDGELVDIFLCT